MTTARIAAGIDHALYSYAPTPLRALEWPGGKRLAVAFVVHLEHRLLMPANAGHADQNRADQNRADQNRADPSWADAHGRFHPDIRTHTWREYGQHTWLSGMPHRIRYLDEALGRIAGCTALWHTQPGAIARHFAARRPWKEHR